MSRLINLDVLLDYKNCHKVKYLRPIDVLDTTTMNTCSLKKIVCGYKRDCMKQSCGFTHIEEMEGTAASISPSWPPFTVNKSNVGTPENITLLNTYDVPAKSQLGTTASMTTKLTLVVDSSGETAPNPSSDISSLMPTVIIPPECNYCTTKISESEESVQCVVCHIPVCLPCSKMSHQEFVRQRSSGKNKYTCPNCPPCGTTIDEESSLSDTPIRSRVNH